MPVAIDLQRTLASMCFGYVLGFGYFTAWDAYKLTRKARNPSKNLFTWMVYGLIFACVGMAGRAWFVFHDLIQVSVVSLFLTLCLWVVQVHSILQIIINQVAIISPSQNIVMKMRIGIAVFIGIINVTVIEAFIPSVLEVSPSVTTGGEAYVKIAKVLILMTDCFLNFYFISEVKDNLVRNGLRKYDKMCQFNMGIIVVSVLFDLFLFATTFLPDAITFVAFLPVTYITKLKIELSMTKLIIKIAKEDSNAPRQQRSVESGSTAVPSTMQSDERSSSSTKGPTHIRDKESTRNFGLGFGKSQHRPSASTEQERERLGHERTSRRFLRRYEAGFLIWR